ncbi:hypothetical protein Tco_0712453 [Tanacetum coccineum]
MTCGRMTKMKSLKKSTMVESKVMEKETIKIGGGIYTLGVFISTHSQMIPRAIHSRDQRSRKLRQPDKEASRRRHMITEGGKPLAIDLKSSTDHRTHDMVRRQYHTRLGGLYEL